MTSKETKGRNQTMWGTVLVASLFFSGHGFASTVEYVGLDWLVNSTETSGLSREQVEQKLETGGVLEGFRYATYSEWDLLFSERYPLVATNEFSSPEGARDDVLRFVTDFGMADLGIESQSTSVASDNWFILFGDDREDIVVQSGVGPSETLGLGLYVADNEGQTCEYEGQTFLCDGGSLGLYIFKKSDSLGTGQFSLLVRDSEVSAVPLPAAVWLFSSGLIGLIGLARRKHD